MSLRQNTEFIRFPFRIEEDGVQITSRSGHIQDQIETLLFTGNRERILRPEFGLGVSQLVFEAAHSLLCRYSEKKIQSALSELLAQEADPASITVSVVNEQETLTITISYTLLTLNQSETLQFSALAAQPNYPWGTEAIQWDLDAESDIETVTPSLELNFTSDPKGSWSAQRTIQNLPQTLPPCPDQFDYKQKDWDSYRFSLLSELKESFPQRKNWSIADIETVLCELLAYGLDIIADKSDRFMNNFFLETAVQPERILAFSELLGFKLPQWLPANVCAGFWDEEGLYRRDRVIAYLQQNPHVMELIRHKAPEDVVQQERMVTLEDYHTRVLTHPLVQRAIVKSHWNGSESVICLYVLLVNDLDLDVFFDNDFEQTILYQQIKEFHQAMDMSVQQSGLLWMPDITDGVSPRMLLSRFLDLYRMAGQKVEINAPTAVGIDLSLSITIQENFYTSEVIWTVKKALSDEESGFFEPGRLDLGSDITAGDLMQWLMAIPGVANVEIHKLTRSGSYVDQTLKGHITLRAQEYAVLKNRQDEPLHGTIHLQFQGGLQG